MKEEFPWLQRVYPQRVLHERIDRAGIYVKAYTYNYSPGFKRLHMPLFLRIKAKDILMEPTRKYIKVFFSYAHKRPKAPR